MAQYPWQIQLPSLAEAFAGASHLARTKMAIDDRQRELDASLKRAQAVKAYQSGDRSLLPLVDPDLFGKLEERRVGQQTESAKMIGRLGQILQTGNVQGYAAGRQHAINTGLATAEQLPDPSIVSPEDAPQLGQKLLGMGQAAGMEMPGEQKPLSPVQAERETAAMLGYGVDVERARSDERFQDVLNQRLTAGDKRNQVNVQNILPGGGVEPQKKILAEQQNVLLEGRKTQSVIKELRGLATTPEGKQNFQQFLGYLPKGQAWTLDKLSKVSEGLVPDAAKPWMSKMYEFTAVLDKYKAEEYHRLLGGAQTSVEIKNLVNSVINSDMGSMKFEAALNALERMNNIAMQVASEVQTRGIAVGTSEFARALDKTVGQRTREEMDQTALQLEGSGLTPQQIATVLYRKGLMKYEKAKQINPGLIK